MNNRDDEIKLAEAISCMESLHGTLNDRDNDCLRIVLDAALASQAQQTESQWISVDKYEPKDGDVVYVYHKTVKEVVMAVCEANQHYTRFTSKKFGSEPISYYTHVAHVCMPLPPAPEGGDK